MYVFSGCHSYTGNESSGNPIGILVGAIPISPQHGYFELGEKDSYVDLHFHFVSNQYLLRLDFVFNLNGFYLFYSVYIFFKFC